MFCVVMLLMVTVLSLFGGDPDKEAVLTSKQLEHDVQKAYENILCSCVRVQANGHYGSGSIIHITEEEIVIVSNKHVLCYLDENSYVSFWDENTARVEVIGISETYDLGFAKIRREDLGDCADSYRCVRADAKIYEKLKKNDTFFMVDIASDMKNPQIYTGEVIEKEKYLQDYEAEMFYGDAYAKPGMSGCGLFDGYGNYIGILSGGTPYVEVAAVGLDKVMAEYQKIVNRT